MPRERLLRPRVPWTVLRVRLPDRLLRRLNRQARPHGAWAKTHRRIVGTVALQRQLRMDDTVLSHAHGYVFELPVSGQRCVVCAANSNGGNGRCWIDDDDTCWEAAPTIVVLAHVHPEGQAIDLVGWCPREELVHALKPADLQPIQQLLLLERPDQAPSNRVICWGCFTDFERPDVPVLEPVTCCGREACRELLAAHPFGRVDAWEAFNARASRSSG